MDNQIIERPKLSFVEQLEDQINNIRVAQSDYSQNLTPKVECLDALLHAKLINNKKYNASKKRIKQWLKISLNELESDTSDRNYQTKTPQKLEREASVRLFKALMVFIEEKNFFGGS